MALVGKIIEDQSDQCITDHMDIVETDIVIVPTLETLILVITVCGEVDSYPTPKGRTMGSIAGRCNSKDVNRMGSGHNRICLYRWV